MFGAVVTPYQRMDPMEVPAHNDGSMAENHGGTPPPMETLQLLLAVHGFHRSGHRLRRIRQHLGSRIPRRLLHLESVSRQKGKKRGVSLFLGLELLDSCTRKHEVFFVAPLVFSWGFGLTVFLY